MEDSRSKENRTLHAWKRWHTQHPWAMRCNVRIMTTRTWLINKRTAHSRVSVHVRCVGVLGLGGNVVIGVVLGFTTKTQYQVQISFLLDFVVHFCTCSQTEFCDRQFSSVANYCTLLHRKNGSLEVLSLHPAHPGSLDMISMTYAAFICDADDPCSVNTA